MKAATVGSIALIGLAATVGQIIVLRELLTVFSGSELSLALVLGSWLLWTALGSSAAARVIHRLRRQQRFFGWLQLSCGVVLVGTVLVIRALRPLLHIGPGELVTLGQMLFIAFSCLAPFCLLAGFLFTLACQLLSIRLPQWSRSPGLVYFLEGLGAGIGGLVFSVVLVHRFNVISIVAGVAICLCLGGYAVARSEDGKGRSSPLLFVLVAGMLLAVQLWGRQVDLLSRSWQWHGFELLDSEDTVYGQISVVSSGGQISFFENGLWNFTVPDLLTAEQAVHFALLEHPAPRTVLLLGGGISGTLREVLRQKSVERLYYVELDPRLVALGKRYLDHEVVAALDDPRVEVHNVDARSFLANTPDSYDVIMVNLPEPFTAQLNRFYTVEFFRLAASRLADAGVLAFRVSAAENTLGPLQAAYVKLLFNTAEKVFPAVVLFPGQTARFFCAKMGKFLTRDPEVLVQRIRQRHLQLKYVQDYYLLWDLSLERQANFLEMIEDTGYSRVNTDLQPRGYFANLLIWGSQFSEAIPRIYRALSAKRLWFVAVGGAVAVVCLGLIRRRKKGMPSAPRTTILLGVAVFGYTEMSLEFIIVLSYQIFFGSLYQQIGLLVTLYMIGLAAGSALLSHYPTRPRRLFPVLICCQAMLALLCLALAAVFYLFEAHSTAVTVSAMARLAFYVMSLTAGMLGGTHFPLANRLLAAQRPGMAKVAGMVYGVDLVGSFVGSLLIALVFIVALGVLQSLLMLALVNVAAVMLLSMRREWLPEGP
ncbi:MAG: fused MFS/spermidine synthase [Deltaproteobacteria bacterium]|nr:fused MFS/spermidine synthase [Deltaproteobacteria bacterium]MBW2069845.1 fused MFS/spermidine synthase [Deltaproteobacteria bacterium]